MFDSNSSRATYGISTEISPPAMVTRSAIAFTEARSRRSYAWFAVEIATRYPRIEFTMKSSSRGPRIQTSSCVRRFLRGFAFEDISQTAQRDDAHTGALQALAQAVDVHLDRLGAGALAESEDVVVQGSLRDRLPRARDQHLEDRVLLRAQREHLAPEAEHAIHAAVFELAQSLQRARRSLRAAD